MLVRRSLAPACCRTRLASRAARICHSQLTSSSVAPRKRPRSRWSARNVSWTMSEARTSAARRPRDPCTGIEVRVVVCYVPWIIRRGCTPGSAATSWTLRASVGSTEVTKLKCVTYEVGGQRLAGFRGVSRRALPAYAGFQPPLPEPDGPLLWHPALQYPVLQMKAESPIRATSTLVEPSTCPLRHVLGITPGVGLLRGLCRPVEFPTKSGHGVKLYSACSYAAGDTYPREECRRLVL